MYSAFRNEPEKVYVFAVLQSIAIGFLNDTVMTNIVVLNFKIYSDEILIHNSACAYIQMPYFRIAHLAFGQPHIKT
ncbi:MAG: hypothetical protein BWY70_01267 [Bacteroidetes bacterium ADurb.Bin408]|nr:MAG: hypothetical protein BWY70_01267 [Bacteroidetes bacterium ADurb.Bin408]